MPEPSLADRGATAYETPGGGPEPQAQQLAAGAGQTGCEPYAAAIESFVVVRDGLQGKREHWVPGNFRRGTPPREKRAFATAKAALEALRDRPGKVYTCSICDRWHIASVGGRRGL